MCAFVNFPSLCLQNIKWQTIFSIHEIKNLCDIFSPGKSVLQVFHHNVIPNITWSHWGRDISKSFHRIERQHLAFNYYLDSGCAVCSLKLQFVYFSMCHMSKFTCTHAQDISENKKYIFIFKFQMFSVLAYTIFPVQFLKFYSCKYYVPAAFFP